jgi:hypothetical protein
MAATQASPGQACGLCHCRWVWRVGRGVCGACRTPIRLGLHDELATGPNAAIPYPISCQKQWSCKRPPTSNPATHKIPMLSILLFLLSRPAVLPDVPCCPLQPHLPSCTPRELALTSLALKRWACKASHFIPLATYAPLVVHLCMSAELGDVLSCCS